MHLGMLGVVSIFTGMISPVVKNNMGEYPFPLTDMQIPAYFVFLLLAILCILLSVRLWAWIRAFWLIIFILLGYLFVIAYNGDVKTGIGILAPLLSWGWGFIFIGSVLLLSSILDTNIKNESATLWDHLIGWVGGITILALTGIIIWISYIPQGEHNNKNRILENIFGSGNIETHSGIIQTKVFPSIERLVFDRKHDSLNFFTLSGTKILAVPSGQYFDRLPYMTTSIGNALYTISAEWSVITESGDTIWIAILPQKIDQAILMYSGNTLMKLNTTGIHTLSGKFNSIEDIISTPDWAHSIWKSKTGSGYTIYRDSEIQWENQYSISYITSSSNGKSIMSLVKETDGSQYIMKNGIKIEKIWSGYIENSLRMNGNSSIYTIEENGYIELVFNGKIMDRKFDEIREIFLDRESDEYTYFGRPLGEQTYCLYTRYRGNLCKLSGYMNPRLSPDWTGIIFAWLKDGAWWIYRNAIPIIRNTGYPNRENISKDYVFFDVTNPSYYLFIRNTNNGYQLYKKWAWLEGTWKDIGLDASFGYDNKIIMSVQDASGWRIIEI